MSKPNYSHTYQTCAYSMKRKEAPWRVSSGCEGPLVIFTGRHYELTSSSVCCKCPFYCRDTKLKEESD